MNAPLGLGFRDPLYAVSARFELELRVDTLPDDARDDLLESAHVADALRNHFHLPAISLAEAYVHSKELAGEQCGLVAAGAGANFQEYVALVVGVPGQKDALQLILDALHRGFRHFRIVFGERLDFRVIEKLARGCEVLFGLLPIVVQRDHRGNFGVLARQGSIAIQIARDIRRSQKAI